MTTLYEQFEHNIMDPSPNEETAAEQIEQINKEIVDDKLKIENGSTILKETEARNVARRELVSRTQDEIANYTKQLEEIQEKIRISKQLLEDTQNLIEKDNDIIEETRIEVQAASNRLNVNEKKLANSAIDYFKIVKVAKPILKKFIADIRDIANQ